MNTAVQIQNDRAAAFADDPMDFFNLSFTESQSIGRAELEELQLAALQYRFDSLRDRVKMLQKLADRQGIHRIDSLEEVVPLLFEHTMYKSYPRAILEKGRFDQLTRWLDKLTAIDLSGVDASACRGITDWAILLDETTPMKISHSSGTSGTMSFNPFSKHEYDMLGKTWPMCYFQDFGDPPADPDHYIPNIHVIMPGYRYGVNGFVRGVDMFAKYIAGSEERLYCMNRGRLDSDVLFLAARIRAAKARGELDKLKISPELLARQKEFEQEQARSAADREAFFQELIDKLAGERIFMMAPWNMMFEMAKTGLDRGMKKVFSPESVIVSAGGAKGLERPDNWQDIICEFVGVESLTGGYGMSELTGLHKMCSQGHYHVMPWVVPFLLDPDTSELLPRQGVTTGRAAFLDLMLDSHWGGYISGDEVTVHWDCDCPCGQSTVYIEDNVTRYSEKRGGDDKITCTATADAHREAMDYLTSFEA